MKRITLLFLLLPLAIFSQPTGMSFLDGKFIAPVGVKVTITKDGTDNLVLVAKPNGNQTYTVTDFKFPKAYTNGKAYTLSIKSVTPGITCRIDKGIRGTISLSPGFIRVGADYTYDHISRSSDNKTLGTYYESQSPVVGGDFLEEGRYVAFVSSAANLENSSGKHRQIFWRDRKTGITKMVSRVPHGDEGNGDSFAPAIAVDGQSVAFESHASNLVTDDGNKLRDVFKWNAADNSVVLVSSSGTASNGESYEPTISGDGNMIAFSSGASNLAAGVSDNSMINVYLKDLSTGTIKLLTVNPVTGKAAGGSSPSISQNGTRVAFCSFASTLVENDGNGLWDIFVYDNTTAKMQRISMGFGGSERMQGNESASRVVSPSISGNGVFVAYATTAPNVVENDTNGMQDVFLTNVDLMSTVRLSTGSTGEQSNADSPIGQGEKVALSFDGNFVAFTTNATNLAVPSGNIVLRNTLSNEIIAVSKEPGASVGRPAISRNGGYVVFGIGARLDGRYSSSGLFANFTAKTRCLACNE
ncbi:MAG: hypothetical protein RIS73_1872 [Bacteroidota bacterium]|jgi:hypothetical protein